MRLICGLWNISGEPVSHTVLQAMCDAMQSPVMPGTREVWTGGAVGLGFLSFGETNPAQPIAPHASGLVTVADARLDEGYALRQTRNLPQNITDPDTICALRMDEAAAAIIGDLAVAQWSPVEKKLSLTRDALGVRPLCYHYLPGRHLVFGSLPSGIFASGLVGRTLDRQQFARELLNVPDAAATLFEGIRNVLPGHTVEISAGRERASCYWRAAPRPPLRCTREAAALQLRDLLQKAVDASLGSTGPVAAHLSGGLDSSALCVLASRSLQTSQRQLLAYSFLSETWPGLPMEGERPYVDAVLQQEPGIAWQSIESVFSPDWLADQWNPDAPLVLSHGSPENAVCLDSSRRGASVVLSGWGGDEGITFNGRGAFAASFRQGQWVYLLKQLRGMRRERGFRLRHMLLGDVAGPLLSAKTTNRLRGLAGRHRTAGPSMAAFLSPDLLILAGPADPVETEADTAKVQAALLHNGHLSFRTARFAAIGARYGMAFCFPLLNRRVVEFALSMPPVWHIHAGWKRRLFREAMEGVLPPAVQWRHSKFRSLPKVPYHFAAERDRVLRRVEELAANPVVSNLFRMEEAKAVLRALPLPDKVTDPGTHPALTALPFLAQLLDYAFFVEQHFPA